MTPEKIISIVSHISEVPVNEIMSKSRIRKIVQPRQICHYFIRKFLQEFTLDNVASLFGKLNHATICHSVKTVNALKKHDKSYKEMFLKIEEAIRNDINTENQELLNLLEEVKAKKMDVKKAHDKILMMGINYLN
tara:strand:- start:86 stop:490 length:405 start_codon:yes stop_codon:yes gene_type:complete